MNRNLYLSYVTKLRKDYGRVMSVPFSSEYFVFFRLLLKDLKIKTYKIILEYLNILLGLLKFPVARIWLTGPTFQHPTQIIIHIE
jgi:hypothetical protein